MDGSILLTCDDRRSPADGRACWSSGPRSGRARCHIVRRLHAHQRARACQSRTGSTADVLFAGAVHFHDARTNTRSINGVAVAGCRRQRDACSYRPLVDEHARSPPGCRCRGRRRGRRPRGRAYPRVRLHDGLRTDRRVRTREARRTRVDGRAPVAVTSAIQSRARSARVARREGGEDRGDGAGGRISGASTGVTSIRGRRLACRPRSVPPAPMTVALVGVGVRDEPNCRPRGSRARESSAASSGRPTTRHRPRRPRRARPAS